MIIQNRNDDYNNDADDDEYDDTGDDDDYNNTPGRLRIDAGRPQTDRRRFHASINLHRSLAALC